MTDTISEASLSKTGGDDHQPAVNNNSADSLVAPSNAKFSCRMYENIYPEVDDLVMVTVGQIADMGAYVSLVEYNGIEGMVLLSELSRRRIRSVQRLIRVGKNEVVVVLRVDRDKGYIDLSKRRVSPEEIDRFEEKFNKSKTVHSIMRHVAEKHNVSLEELYKVIAWPLYRIHGHAFDAFKLALTDPAGVWESLLRENPDSPYLQDPRIKNDLFSAIVRRLTPQKLKIRADIDVACFGYEGIDAVKAALYEGEAVGTAEVPLKVRLVAPPLYVIVAQCMDKAKGLALVQEAIDKIEASIKANGGQLVVKMKPKAVNEVDDKELDALMKRSEMENTEVSGDDENSE